MAVGPLFADTKSAMVVQVVMTEDTDAYVAGIAKANALIKARTGVEQLRHVWVGDVAGDNSHGVFVVSTYPSAAAMYADQAKMKDYPEMDQVLADFKKIRHLGPSYLYKSIRNEGGYAGGAVYNTSIACTDEDAYAKALDGLKAIMDANGFKDIKVNLWRIVAGRTNATHLVVIALPSQTRVAELIDALADKNLLKEWNVGAAKIRTAVHNGTYHEISK